MVGGNAVFAVRFSGSAPRRADIGAKTILVTSHPMTTLSGLARVSPPCERLSNMHRDLSRAGSGELRGSARLAARQKSAPGPGMDRSLPVVQVLVKGAKAVGTAAQHPFMPMPQGLRPAVGRVCRDEPDRQHFGPRRSWAAGFTWPAGCPRLGFASGQDLWAW